ncbi:T9SS type A sorting domain-containing protein [Riemerella columbina]|uniref:T9SS type A sorting domain-containing protein n=1 Tax=Riemerella columbina TaxID=103810 RepID=UPI0003A6B43A|nr:T9SS type A sorting domain-containing protein [Riemerella columbina]
MKKIFTLSCMALSMPWSAQEYTKTLDFGNEDGDYRKSGFYNFENNNATLVENFSWDVAFYTKDSNKVDIRVNNTGGVTLYYPNHEESDINNYTNEPNIYDGSMTQYINILEQWGEGGAFQQNANASDAMDYGWGTRQADGTIQGNKVIILNSPRGEYYKIKINYKDNSGYNVSYAKYDGSAWGAVNTIDIPYTSGSEMYTYYSIANQQTVTVEPNQHWDIWLQAYKVIPNTSKGPGGYDGFDNYFGVLQNPNIKVAKVTESEGVDDVADSRYKSEANTIGDQWNKLHANNYDEDIQITQDRYFFIKNNSGVYRLEFLALKDMFNGHKTTFKNKKLSDNGLGVDQIGATTNENKVYLATNPTINKTIDLVFDYKNNAHRTFNLVLYNMSGQQVYTEQFNESQSFFNKRLKLSKLPAGIYVLRLAEGQIQKTFKIILK